MSCPDVDLKAWFLGEADRSNEAACASHVTRCEECQEELERLRLTRSALMSVPEEELPRRIAFVSDGVFQPRWWQAFLRPGPVVGFVSAGLIAGAILAHGAMQPAPVMVMRTVTVPAQVVDTAAMERRLQKDLNARVQQAVAEMDRKQRIELAAAQQSVQVAQQQLARLMWAYNPPVERSGQ